MVHKVALEYKLRCAIAIPKFRVLGRQAKAAFHVFPRLGGNAISKRPPCVDLLFLWVGGHSSLAPCVFSRQ